MNSLRAGIIAARVAVVVELFPGVIVAPLMIGTLAASGGKLCVDTIMQLVGPKPSGTLDSALPRSISRSVKLVGHFGYEQPDPARVEFGSGNVMMCIECSHQARTCNVFIDHMIWNSRP